MKYPAQFAIGHTPGDRKTLVLKFRMPDGSREGFAISGQAAQQMIEGLTKALREVFLPGEIPITHHHAPTTLGSGFSIALRPLLRRVQITSEHPAGIAIDQQMDEAALDDYHQQLGEALALLRALPPQET